jgi:hypothetical protein
MPTPQTRDVGGQHHHLAVVQGFEHAAHGLDAALLADIAPARAGAPDRPDAKMPERNGVELAIRRAGDEARRAILGPFGEMDHEMLPVPHGGDHGHLRSDTVIGIRRLNDEPVRAVHELEIARNEEAQALLDRPRADDALEQTHRCRKIRPAAGLADGADGR